MGEFVTDIFLVTSRDGDLSTFIADTTIKGHDANLWESTWTNKGRRFLGYKKSPSDQYVVTELWVGSDDKDPPDDFAGVLITKDTKEKGLRKQLLAYKRDQKKAGMKAIVDIVIVKGEPLPMNYTEIGQSINERKIACKFEEILPTAPAKPPQIPPRKANPLPRQESSMGSPSAGIDGIPFQINPKFDSKSFVNDPIVSGISTISADEILSKFNYSFDTERKAVEIQ